MFITKMFRNSSYSFLFALVLGLVLAVSASVWATSVGTNITITGTLSVDSTTASSSVTHALGVGTTTPAIQLSVGGSAGTATGHAYFTGGVGVGIATTTAGGLQLTGNALLGDAAGDYVSLNAASLILNNQGTTTIVSSNADAWNVATSSASIPFVKYDTSNYRIGVSTTSPTATLSVGGAGDIYALGGVGIGIATSSAAGSLQITGNALFGDAAGDYVSLNAADLILNNQGSTTIVSSNADAWNIATSSASIPFVKYDTSNYRIGISTTSITATLEVGGAGHIYALGGLGIGRATTTAGVIENTGNTLLGDASGDLVMFNSATHVYNNAGTSTIVASDADSWSIATSSASIPFVKYDTSNYRIGIGTTTPGATLAVEGDGDVILFGQATSSLSIQSGGATKGGCIELETTEGNAVVSLMATSSGNVVYWVAGGCQ